MQRIICNNRREQKELNKRIEASGFQILYDLDTLYDMIKYYKRLSGLSKELRKRGLKPLSVSE